MASKEICRICNEVIFVRLGGFHFVMSYLGSMGTIMNDSDLRNQWETVYAHNSVNHMLTGHAYARALRAHMLSVASLVAHMFDTPNCLSGVNLNKVKSLHDMLLKHMCLPQVLTEEHAITQLSQIMDDLQQDESMSSRTGKLWIEYLTMVIFMLLFIRAERTGDLELHLYCIAKMIPVLDAGGHTAYAQSSRLYLDQMKNLNTIMGWDQFAKYTSDGYWTIRRSNRFWSGNFTDQTIEQVLMRMVKSKGGLAHGRGVTASTQYIMVHIIPPNCSDL